MAGDTVTASWRTDPTGRHEHRYHDGERWTDHVADRGVQANDPYEPTATTAPTAWPGSSSAPDVSPSVAPATPPRSSSATSPAGAPSAVGTDGAPSWSTGGPAGPTQGRSAGWSDAPPSTPSRSSGDASGSNGRRVVLVLVVLALMAVAALGGFFAGLAVDVGGAIEEGLTVGERAAPGEAADSGAVLSAAQPQFVGSVDGPTSWTVQVDQPGMVALEVTAADFDTYLTLHDGAGGVLAEDDDSGSGGTLLSRVEAQLQPGTYTLVLDSWTGGVDAGTPVELTATFAGLG